MLFARELIEKKRDGEILSDSEISAFISGVASGEVTDAHIAAFTMATWFNGMSGNEQSAMIRAMRDSGDVMQWPDLDGPVLDKHSTGGVGDMVSLILGPVVAACGAFVPMISGRGLGHTGGTLDKLESIPGLDTRLTPERFSESVRDVGIAIIGQTGRLAPADRRMYAIRDITATVSSTPLIVSSILSKKLAEGLDGLVLDIKCGNGAFMENRAAAESLAEEMARVSAGAGLPCRALVTDMNQPLAWTAGNALEIHEVVRFLTGQARHPRLEEVVRELSAELLLLGGLGGNVAETRARVDTVLNDGTACETFSRMVCAQGGPHDLVDKPEEYLPPARLTHSVYAPDEAFVKAVDTHSIGMTVVRLGGGRLRSEDTIDPSVGLSGLCSIGERVGPDSAIATIHARNEDELLMAEQAVKAAVELGRDAPEPSPLLIACYGGFDG